MREHAIPLHDGRNYHYFEQGHPAGRVILNIHSLFDGVIFPQKVSVDLVRAGYRLISPLRAGFGLSDPDFQPNINARIEAKITDMKELLDHLNVDKF